MTTTPSQRPGCARCKGGGWNVPLGLAILWLLHPGIGVAAAAQASPAPPAAATPPAGPTALPLSEIAPQAQTALASLSALEPDDTVDTATETVRQSLPDLTSRIDALVDQRAKAVAAGAASSLDSIHDLLAGWHKLQDAVDERGATLAQRAKTLEAEASQARETLGLWQATKKAAEAKDANAPPETLGLATQVVAAATAAGKRIQSRRTPVLELQSSLGAINARAIAATAAVQEANAQAVKTLLVPDRAPIWLPESMPQAGFFDRWLSACGEQWLKIREYAASHGNLFAVHLGIFLVLLALLLWLRRGLDHWTAEEPQLQRAAPVFRMPIATALALSFVIKGSIYSDAPELFRVLMGTSVLLPTVFILHRVVDRRLAPVLYSLVVFYLLDLLRVDTEAFPATNRWIFCVQLAGAICAFFFLARAQRAIRAGAGASLGVLIPLLDVLAISVFVAALAATVMGYVRLGELLGRGALRSAYVAVLLYALLRIVDGLIVIGLHLRPLRMSRIARTHHEAVRARVYRVARFAGVLLWVTAALTFFQIRAPVFDTAAVVLGHPLTLGTVSLSLGQLLSFALAIWLSLEVSRFLRFFLDEEIYERVQLSPGLPYAISTILNYLVLFVGFLIALGLLGVHLTQITILAGAFSVGLGFGLQNIINNFVSGIILLFERPVKVGDVIQVGDATGEVRRIGIRASVVRTRDGSDLILPNGNLISNSFVNWTYGDRCRSLEIPLGIAPGVDLAHVFTLLRDTLAAQPAAANRPDPEIYLASVTAGSLNVVVRAWTTKAEDWVEVRSDLLMALTAALARENIKLA